MEKGEIEAKEAQKKLAFVQVKIRLQKPESMSFTSIWIKMDDV